MSDAEEKSDKSPGEEELPPTVSFGDSVVRPGSRIGPFRIEREISRGPMGVVYLAHDTKLDRPVAIKSLPAEVMGDPKVLSRWKREARLLASLNHPNIATIYEELEEAKGVGYLVLEYVPGDTLAERIAGGEVKLEEVLSIGTQIAAAMSAAHDKGVIHRDLKPGNIKITPEGKVKVLDFGLAKTVGERPSAQQSTAVTQPGHVIGTPGYMSPEQALGSPVDHRSDIWSFGCVLYKMLTRRLPFSGQTISDVLASILTAEPDWETLPVEVGPVLRNLIRKCLEKDAERRYQSAAELYQELLDYQASLTAPVPKAIDLKVLLRSVRKLRLAVPVVLVFLALCIAALWLINRSAKVRWARVEAIPEIIRLIKEDNSLAAFSLARQAERYIPRDPMLKKLWPDMSHDYSIITTPPGAAIFFKEYSAIEGEWEYLGQSPLENIKFPHGIYRWKINKDGFETRECVADRGRTLNVELWQEGSFPPGMVRIPFGSFSLILYPFGYLKAGEAPPYWIDKYEVTNQRFKEFVNNGGYQNRDYWKHEFVKDGRILSWERAMDEFRGTTGRPGPSTWEGGIYPKGQERYPVGGVSWYEAAAYSEFIKKSLPTIYHWSRAARPWEASVIVPFSNFSTKAPAPVGSCQGIGMTGLYDMAGNVKEWCWNATNDLRDRRYILGGSWSEPTYMFTNADTRSPWDRSPDHGFRCVRYPDGEETVPDTLFDPIERPFVRDYSTETPVSDEDFQFYKKLYAYDRTELNAVVESVDESPDYWRKEKITFDAAYGNERVIAYLFLPKGLDPPYQTVVFFPGGGAFRDLPSENIKPWRLAQSIIMSGRAFMWPVYKGSFERHHAQGPPDLIHKPIAHQDWIIQLSKDLGRSIDYLETRDDMDHERIAYHGRSRGSWLGPIMLAMEERIKVGVFFAGGFGHLQKPAAIDAFNFAPRVKVPILMINGREDFIFPLETSQIPMYESLGTSAEDKKHFLYPGGHGPFGLPLEQIRRHVLDWLERYLGPVD